MFPSLSCLTFKSDPLTLKRELALAFILEMPCWAGGWRTLE